MYTNQAELELKLNGIALTKPTKHTGVIWIWQDVELKSGNNLLEACAKADNRVIVKDSVKWTLNRGEANSSETENAQPFHQAK